MPIKPILFNTEMVRAILDGRKSCTRRIIKGFIPKDAQFGYTAFTPHGSISCRGVFENEGYGEKFFKLPYQIGDILYVRETVWQKIGYYLDVDGETKPSWYNEFRYVASDEKPENGWNYGWAKRPSIHMPKEAARIFLRVTNVRVERLQDITVEDALAEGMDKYIRWDANPWVWGIEFERCEKPEGV